MVFESDTAHRMGAVVLGFAGDVTVDALVAQGCRPIGAVGRVWKGGGIPAINMPAELAWDNEEPRSDHPGGVIILMCDVSCLQ